MRVVLFMLPNYICAALSGHTHNYMHSAGKFGNGQWPNAPNFSPGPPEISTIWALVAQIYLSGSNK